jgi:hypothetical protein
MKKLLSFALVLGLGAILLSGCQQAQQAAAPPVPASTAANSVGSLVSTGLGIDNILMGAVGVAGVSAKEVKTTTIATPEYGADGWWHVTFTYGGSISVDSYFRIWSTAQEITTNADLDNLALKNVDKLWIYAAWSIGSVTMNFGASKDNPLKFTGVGANSTSAKSLSGPISFAGTDEDGTSYSITLTYSDVSLSSSGYPNGNVSFSISSGGTEVIAGTISFNGTATATLTFSTGYSGTYSIDLLTGAATPVST